MRQPAAWIPRMSPGPGPAPERLAAALAEDIAAERLRPGARLPPHRQLADNLKLSVVTVGRAYALLERQGLVRGEHGRGTFVSASIPDETAAVIDLSLNLPPPILAEAQFAAALQRVAARAAGISTQRYPPPAGRLEHRRAAARWLAGHRIELPAERLLLTNGAQHAIMIALGLICRPGDALLVESVTYAGAKAAARLLGLRLVGLEMDGEGIRSAALAAALGGRDRPAALYLTPTMQNPTGRTLTAERRREIAALARRHDLPVIEDDVYSILDDPGRPTLAELAPERVFYINSLSKGLSAALRLGLLAVPAGWEDRAAAAVQATAWTASPLTSFVMAEWLQDGTAVLVAEALRREVQARQAIAGEFFPGMRPAGPAAMHLWLPLGEAAAERAARRAQALGVLVTPPGATVVDADRDCGLRLCLGAAASRELLGRGLALVKQAIEVPEDTIF